MKEAFRVDGVDWNGMFDWTTEGRVGGGPIDIGVALETLALKLLKLPNPPGKSWLSKLLEEKACSCGIWVVSAL